jgi:hypothetical protein
MQLWLNAVKRTGPQPGVVCTDRKVSEKRQKTGFGQPGHSGDPSRAMDFMMVAWGGIEPSTRGFSIR